MTDAELAAIKARADAATPGPWNAIEVADTPSGPEHGIAELMGTAADYAFIAAARTDVPRLLAEIERLKTELANHHCESCDGSAPECRPIPKSKQ